MRVVVPSPAGRPAREEILEGVTVTRFANNRGPFWWNWWTENRRAATCVRQALDGAQPGASVLVLQHAFLRRAAASAIRSAAVPAPTVCTYYGPWPEEYLFARSLGPPPWPQRLFHRCIARALRHEERVMVRSAQLVLVLSDWMRLRARALQSGDAAPIQLLPGAVDLARFAPAADRDGVRRAAGVAPGQFVFLAVRRLDPRMGLDLLIEAFAGLEDPRGQSALWLVGDGPARGPLETRIQRLGLGQRVRLLGLLSEVDLVRAYQAADCTVVPSLDLEGFGLATAESLACGTPAMGSSSGATPELLRPLDPKLLFASASIPALRQAMQAALTEPGRLPARTVCRDYATRRFGWDEPVRLFEGACKSLLPGVHA